VDTVVDPLWYRVAKLKPRLRLHLRIQRRRSRGRTWYVLCDEVRQSYFRLDASAFQFIGRLNGETTVDAAWRATHQQLGSRAPTQGEALKILQQLSDEEAIWLGGLGEMSVVIKRKRQRNRLRQGIANPLSIKVGLFDPTPMLRRLRPLGRFLFSGWGAAAWLLMVLWGGVMAVAHAPAIAGGLALNARTAVFLLQMWCLYPLVKLVHEMAHALAVQRWGGTVRECGLNIVMLTPLPRSTAPP
jgi:putative peptide zinc metalloprotease protein